MTDPLASEPKRNRLVWPSQEDVAEALAMHRRGQLLDPPVHSHTLFSDRATPWWLAWLRAYPDLPELMTLCGACGYRWGRWYLDAQQAVPLPRMTVQEDNPGAVNHTIRLAAGNAGALKDSRGHDARGTLYYVCPSRSCVRSVSLNPMSRTRLFLQALYDRQKTISL